MIHPTHVFSDGSRPVIEHVFEEAQPSVAREALATWTIVRHDLYGARVLGRFYQESLARTIAEEHIRSRQLPYVGWKRVDATWVAQVTPLVRIVVVRHEEGRVAPFAESVLPELARESRDTLAGVDAEVGPALTLA